MNQFITKDSGKREQFTSGMQRDTQSGKTLYHLVFDGPMFERWAGLLTRGAEKYDEGNWLKAEGLAELNRFKASAVRHFVQWFRGDTDEDHAAAVVFNLNGAEYVKGKMQRIVAVAEIEGRNRVMYSGDTPPSAVEVEEALNTGDFEYDEARRLSVEADAAHATATQRHEAALAVVRSLRGNTIPVDADPFDQQHDPDYVACDLDECGTTDVTTRITFDLPLSNGGGVIVRKSAEKAEAAYRTAAAKVYGEALDGTDPQDETGEYDDEIEESFPDDDPRYNYLGPLVTSDVRLAGTAGYVYVPTPPAFEEEEGGEKRTWADFLAFIACMFNIAKCG